ncbi:MAG: glutamine-hydrolyzing carbamoyl-phosphate synthase small subunit [Gammaproteobacteria bacterium]|nr:glutamine-hydrolyzing carbamoyl-phosphate synthase small subunit [Gammaproteobacteria bacterium]
MTNLILEDGSFYEGVSFGWPQSIAGEVVFNTGMTGYPESLTDPSYYGQILVLTYPLIGNYGVPDNSKQDGLNCHFESERIQISGLIVADYSRDYSHWNAGQSLAEWLRLQEVPALMGVDTRTLTKKLREKGTMPGFLEIDSWEDAERDTRAGAKKAGENAKKDAERNLVAEVSIKKPQLYGKGKRIVLVDCGCKHNILRSLLARGAEVLRVPWNYDFSGEKCHGVVLSSGPGDPKRCEETIAGVKQALERETPILGICLGHQILALAAGADTYKLKYGHRSQNQPVMEKATQRCFITSQNHGYAVDIDTLPNDWETSYINLNDHTSEGLAHRSGRFTGVQFHPEASPGPVDTAFLFDNFMEICK